MMRHTSWRDRLRLRGVVGAVVFVGITVMLAVGSNARDLSAVEPYKLFRSVAVLREQIVSGNQSAHKLNAELTARLAKHLITVDPEVWKDRRNRLGLIQFLASGGNPSPMVEALKYRVFPEDEASLAIGMLAYATGAKRKAATLLEKVDPHDYPGRLGGSIAIVKAILIEPKDIPAALYLLDQARLLSIGTLVEEAALRVSLGFLLEGRKDAEFEEAALRYFRRFRASIYAPTTIPTIAQYAAERDYASSAKSKRWLNEVASFLPKEQKYRLYAAVADRAIRRGAVSATVAAARSASGFAVELGHRSDHLRVFEGAALVLTDRIDHGVSALLGLEKSRLPKRYRDLVDAALSVASMVRSPPLETATAPTPSKGKVGQAATKLPDTDDYVRRANALLTDANALIKN